MPDNLIDENATRELLRQLDEGLGKMSVAYVNQRVTLLEKTIEDQLVLFAKALKAADKRLDEFDTRLDTAGKMFKLMQKRVEALEGEMREIKDNVAKESNGPT